MSPALRLLPCFLKLRRAVCLAGSGAILLLTTLAVQADAIKIGGTGTGLGAMKLLAQEFNKSRPDAQLLVMPSLGSTGAIKAVLAGAIDLGISARPLSTQEQRQGASAWAYARTPFMLVTGARNKSVGLSLSLSLSELAQIYAGKVSQWPDGSPIRLVVRPEADIDSQLLRAFSAEMSAAVSLALTRPGLRMADTDQDNADALEQLPGSLGTATLSQILTEKRALKALALDRVAPTLEALAAGRYPYYKTLHLVSAAQPSALAKDFAAFVRSPAGQAVLAKAGNLALRE